MFSGKELNLLSGVLNFFNAIKAYEFPVILCWLLLVPRVIYGAEQDIFFNGGGMKLSCMGHTTMSMAHGDDRLAVFYRYI